jgi:hypothetical protein
MPIDVHNGLWNCWSSMDIMKVYRIRKILHHVSAVAVELE